MAKGYPVDGRNPTAPPGSLSATAMRAVGELARAREAALALVARAAGRPRGRGLRGRQRRPAHPPQLHLAHPVQRRRGAQVHRVLRSRHPGRLRRARRAAGRLRQRAERPLARAAPSARSPRRARAAVADPEFVSLPAPRRRARARSSTTTTPGSWRSTTRASSRRAGRSSAAPSAPSRASSRLAELAPDDEGAARGSASSSAATSPSCRSAWRSPRPRCRAPRPTSPR